MLMWGLRFSVRWYLTKHAHIHWDEGNNPDKLSSVVSSIQIQLTCSPGKIVLSALKAQSWAWIPKKQFHYTTRINTNRFQWAGPSQHDPMYISCVYSEAEWPEKGQHRYFKGLQQKWMFNFDCLSPEFWPQSILWKTQFLKFADLCVWGQNVLIG